MTRGNLYRKGKFTVIFYEHKAVNSFICIVIFTLALQSARVIRDFFSKGQKSFLLPAFFLRIILIFSLIDKFKPSYADITHEFFRTHKSMPKAALLIFIIFFKLCPIVKTAELSSGKSFYLRFALFVFIIDTGFSSYFYYVNLFFHRVYLLIQSTVPF